LPVESSIGKPLSTNEFIKRFAGEIPDFPDLESPGELQERFDCFRRRAQRRRENIIIISNFLESEEYLDYPDTTVKIKFCRKIKYYSYQNLYNTKPWELNLSQSQIFSKKYVNILLFNNIG